MRACLVDMFLFSDTLGGERIVCFFVSPNKKAMIHNLYWKLDLHKSDKKTLGLESRTCLNLLSNFLTYNKIKMQSNR